MEVYAMMSKDQIQGSVEVYTEAVHACSKNRDLDTALAIYKDLKDSIIQPDEVHHTMLLELFSFVFEMWSSVNFNVRVIFRFRI